MSLEVGLVAGALAVASNRIVEAFVAPIRKRYPLLDMWWLVYVGWLVGGILSWLAGVNIFAEVFKDPITGQVVTAIAVGGGANLLADIIGYFKGQS